MSTNSNEINIDQPPSDILKCVECQQDIFEINKGSIENPLCASCYEKMLKEYTAVDNNPAIENRTTTGHKDSFIDQIKLIFLTIYNPKLLFQNLSQDNYLLIAFMTNAYFIYSRFLRNGNYHKLVESTSLNPILVFFIIIITSGVFLIIVSYILHFIFWMFKKKITPQKLFNIIGISQAPRLFISIPLSIYLNGNKDILINVMVGNISPQYIILMTLGILTLIYSIILMVYGISISNKNRK